MISKSNFFHKYNFNSKKLNNNLKKTKKHLENIKLEVKNFDIPVLKSYEKKYIFDFSKTEISFDSSILSSGVGKLS